MPQAQTYLERTHSVPVVLDAALPPEEGVLTIKYLPRAVDDEFQYEARMISRLSDKRRAALDALDDLDALDSATTRAADEESRRFAELLLPALVWWDMTEDAAGQIPTPIDIPNLTRFGGQFMARIISAIMTDMRGPDAGNPQRANGQTPTTSPSSASRSAPDPALLQPVALELSPNGQGS
jgi:hypothetical protein